MKLLSKASVVGMVACLCGPALAGGPGTYTVKGTDGAPDSDYTGTLTITQTSDSTFQLIWNIAGVRTEGFGIGSPAAIAVSFKSKDANGTALLVDDDAGGYKEIWAFTGEKKLGMETIAPTK